MNIFELTRILNEAKVEEIMQSKKELNLTTNDVVEEVIAKANKEQNPKKKERILDDFDDNLDRAKSFIISLEKQIEGIDNHDNKNLTMFLNKNIERLRNVGITQTWIMKFLNTENVTFDLSHGFHRWEQCCPELLKPRYVEKFFNMSRNTKGPGEFLLELLGLKTNKNTVKPETGQGGDINIDGINYEVKGGSGRLDGTQLNDVCKIIRQNPNTIGFQIDVENTPKEEIKSILATKPFTGVQTQDKNLVYTFLSEFFKGRNKSGKLIVVNVKGYYVIEQEQKIDDEIIKITIPRWIRYYAYTEEVLPHNDNDRMIKISIVKIK